MPSNDPRIDAYIEKSADFARPILEHIRKLVHKACPDVEEKWKWSFPNFDYKGPMCHMAAFKEHAALGFWKQSLLEQEAFPAEKTAMGSFGRITSKKDLPPDKAIIGNGVERERHQGRQTKAVGRHEKRARRAGRPRRRPEEEQKSPGPVRQIQLQPP
jgi:hypothetical protein